MFTIGYIGSNGYATSVTDDPERFAQTWDVVVVSVAQHTDIFTTPAVTGNCIYGGNAIGHSHGFCTADSCY
jgi:hypothetical protein